MRVESDVIMAENIRIFAYGSLLNESSLRKTVPEARNVFPARVFGFKRVFNLASHIRYCSDRRAPVCVLNLTAISSNIAMNGTCFEMDNRSFEALIRREQIYQMYDVQVVEYHDPACVYAAKLFWAKHHQSYRYLRDSENQRHYLNLCLAGCGAYGQQFVDDFKGTTEFWGIRSSHDENRIWQGVY